MMKKLFYCSFILLSTPVLALTPPDSSSTIVEKTAAAYLIQEGKGLFAEGKVRDAIYKFREAASKDITSWKAPYWISQCHYKMYNYGFALKYAMDAVLINNNEVNKEVYEVLGKSNHRLGKIDTAIFYYQKGIELMSKNRAKELNMSLLLEQAKYAKIQLDKHTENLRGLVNENVNSGYNDYSPVLANDGKTMYFTSRRSNTKGGRQNPSDQQFFEDIYRAKWNSELKKWDSITNRIDRLNGDGFESISHISEDGLTAYITINNTALEDPNPTTRSSDIAYLEWTKQGRWSKPRLLDKDFNSTYYDGNATLTADGNTMYFISERKVKGLNNRASDIFVSYKKGRSWTTPKVLPHGINTKGRETTPYITPDGRYLFFSSNGHKNGMGEYDVYVVELKGDEWGEVKNLGPTINTVNNDFGFRIYDKIGKAYINGLNIIGNKASIDIYEYNMHLKDILNQLVD